MKNEKCYCQLSAEREIIKRLIKSLINESQLKLFEEGYCKKLFNGIFCCINPQTKNFLLIPEKIENQSLLTDRPLMEVDLQGNYKEVSYLSLLKYILDIWNVPLEKRKRVCEEVVNSYENMKSAFEWEDANIRFIQEKMECIMCCNSFEQRDEALRISEAIPFKGHPLHACAKTKFGLSKCDHYKYCPEYFTKIPLKLVSVKKKYLKEYGDITLWNEYLEKHTSLKMNSDEVIFPVHPWHFQHILQSALQQELKVVKVENELLEAFPTLSFRTLALPIEQGKQEGIHVKLPIGLQATSVFRLLSERDLYNGIIFSENIKNYYPELMSISSGRGNIVTDLYGAHFVQQLQHPQGPLLSFMIRENPVQYTSHNEKLIVASSLTHFTKNVNKPLLVRFQEKSGYDIMFYAAYLFRTLLCLPLELFLKFGIALDPHGQNCLVKFDHKFLPKTLVYRDLGSIQIVENYPFCTKIKDRLIHPDKTILSYNDCIDEFFHSLYYNLLGDLVDFIGESYAIDRKQLWQMIKHISLEIVKNTECSEEKKDRFYIFLLGATFPIKSLLRMRIEEKTIFNKIPNPLLAR